MAIKFTIEDDHIVCFPTKLLAGNGGAHIFNIVLDEDTDNGVLVGRGDYVSFDQYKAAAAPAGFKGIITEQAANGNWYVEVVDPADAILIYEVPIIAETYDSRFTKLSNFYNAKGKVVRGYELHKGDVFELSIDAFTGDPAPKAAVAFSAGKYTV